MNEEGLLQRGDRHAIPHEFHSEFDKKKYMKRKPVLEKIDK